MVIDDKFVERFNKSKKEKILIIFKKVIKEEPFTSQKAIVSYKFENKYMSFELLDKKWYISNSTSKPKK